VDTGAVVTNVAKKLFELCAAELSLCSKNIRFEGADGSEILMLGVAKLRFIVAGLDTVVVEAFVSENINETSILGIDFSQKRVLESVHDIHYGGGHMGVDCTANRLKVRFYGQNGKQMLNGSLSCAICDLRKRPVKLPKTPLVPSNELHPMQRIEVHVLGGLPTTYKRNRNVLVACDISSNICMHGL